MDGVWDVFKKVILKMKPINSKLELMDQNVMDKGQRKLEKSRLWVNVLTISFRQFTKSHIT